MCGEEMWHGQAALRKFENRVRRISHPRRCENLHPRGSMWTSERRLDADGGSTADAPSAASDGRSGCRRVKLMAGSSHPIKRQTCDELITPKISVRLGSCSLSFHPRFSSIHHHHLPPSPCSQAFEVLTKHSYRPAYIKVAESLLVLASPRSKSSSPNFWDTASLPASPTSLSSHNSFVDSMMDRYYAPNTPEYRAHSRIKEDYLWEDEQGSLNETLIALGASYQALARYISGTDIYLMPRSSTDLLEKLKRYAADAIHNIIAQSRQPIEVGGYGRVLDLAHQSLRSVLATGNNTSDLLYLHVQRNDARPPPHKVRGSHGRAVVTK